ncbi:hypothetical protein MWG58_28815 [Streptomyces sp. WAC00276]|uniref:DUF6197 family protein n=1 Tax=Streptomyces sp. WAC00276 TaxID=2933778 RepID=UPI001FFF0BBA|nr:hypothetical protein [Streptomyces sp. WAC00276]MCK2144846.1 hypothetical protein [Streptomyces sp. WAC00276]
MTTTDLTALAADLDASAARMRRLHEGALAEQRHLLHDADPDSTVPVIRVDLAKRPVVIALRHAARLVQANGLAKGWWYDPAGGQPKGSWPVCAIGALSTAITGDPMPAEAEELDDELRDAVAILARQIESGTDDPIERIAYWNDADERTAADVASLLRRAAREVTP